MKRYLSLMLACIMLFTSIAFTSAEEINITSSIDEAQLKNARIEEILQRAEMQNEAIRNYNLPEFIESDEMSLMASTGVSGRINLPEGVTAKSGDYLYLTLFSASVLEGDKIIEDYGTKETYSTKISLTGGSNSKSYSVTAAAAGDYILAVRYASGNSGITNNYLYYTAVGLTKNPYVADVLKVKSNQTVSGINFTLNKAEAVISGTIDLSAAVPESDASITIRAYRTDYVGGNYSFFRSIDVAGGTKKVDYSLGVETGTYYVSFSSEFFNYGYYSTSGLTNNWDDKASLQITEEGAVLNVAPSSAQSEEIKQIPVTVNFNSAADEYTEYYVILINSNGRVVQTNWTRLEKGSDKLTFTAEIPSSTKGEVYLALKRIWNPSAGSDFALSDKNCLFYSEAYGFAGDLSSASDISNLAKVNINEPAYVNIKGEYTASGDADILSNTYMYLGVQFESESFVTYIPLGSGTFEIPVPKRLAGNSFEVFTATDLYNTTRGVQLLEGSYKLKSTDTTIPSVNLGEYTAVKGNVYLPSPAGADGAIVYIDYNYTLGSEYIRKEAGMYAIMPGESSISYSIAVPAIGSNISLGASLEMFDAVNINDYTYTSLYDTNICDLYFSSTVTASGIISLPEGVVFDEDISFTVSVNQYSDYFSEKFTIPAGETSVSYSMKIAQFNTITNFSIICEDSTGLINTVYYNGSTFVEVETNINMLVSSDIFVSGTLIKASTIALNITIPQNAQINDELSLYAYARSAENEEEQYRGQQMSVTDAGSYTLTIPVSVDPYKEYSIYVNISGDDDIPTNILMGNYTYTSSGWFSGYSEKPAYITADESVPALTISTKADAKISYKLSEDTYCDGFTVHTYLYDENCNEIQSSYDSFDTAAPYETTISYPDNIQSGIVIGFEIYPEGDSNIDCYRRLYYTPSGAVTDFSSAYVFSADEISSSPVNIIIPRQKGIFGKISFNGNYEFVQPLSKISIELVNVNSSGYGSYMEAVVDENLNFSAPFASGTEEGEYYITYYVGQEHTSGTNIIPTDNFTYLTDAEGNNVVISTAQDAKNISITLDCGYAIKGRIYIPDDAEIAENSEFIADINFSSNNNYFYAYADGITSETTYIDYMTGISEDLFDSYNVSVNVRERDVSSFTNLLTDEAYYRVSDTESSTVYDDMIPVTISESSEDIDITLLTGAGIALTFNMPDFIRTHFNVDFELRDEYGSSVCSKSASFSQYNKTAHVSLVVPKNLIGKKSYMSYKINYNIEGLVCNENIYISPDGTLSYSKSNTEMFTIQSDMQSVSANAAKPSDLPIYIETAHPYETGQVFEYTYTHPTPADYLMVTFCENSSIRYDHTITFCDDEGNEVFSPGSYITGQTFSVPGDSFILKFNAFGYNSGYYGFKIIDITPGYYVMESSHPYTMDDYGREWEYEDPNADALEIYFSPNSYMDYDMKLSMIDRDGNHVYEWLGNNVTNLVYWDSNYFKLMMEEAIYDYIGAYGFSIEKIVPIYYHDVTFLDYDGTVLDVMTVSDGEYADYYGVDSLKRVSENEDYIYIFSGWDKQDELEHVTSDLVVTAQYKLVRAYDIVFKNIDGTVLGEQKVPENSQIAYDGETPVYPYETEYTYAFVGWDKKDTIATKDLVLTAVYNRVYLQSSHPYPSSANERYEYTQPGAISMDITFSEETCFENTWDFLSIYALCDGNEEFVGEYTGSELSGATVHIPSDTVVLYLSSDSGVEYYGFAVTDIEAVYDIEDLSIETVAIAQGGKVSYTSTVNKMVGATLVVAAYNSNDTLVYVNKLNLSENNLSLSDVINDSTVAYIKTMLWKNTHDMTPIIEAEFDRIK